MKPLVIAISSAAVLAGPAAMARPVYSIQEGKPCLYCHAKRDDGPLNARGVYYKANKHSFEGYNEFKVMGRSSVPLFHVAWQEALPKTVHRIGIADTVGDKSPRLVWLAQGTAGGAATLTVRKWDGKQWVTELNADVPGGADRLAVGQYAAGRPAVIVTSGALWFWNGSKYETRPSPRPLKILGTVVMRDGSERLLLHEGDSLKTYRVDTSASDWLTGAQDAPPSSQTSFSDMKGTTEELKEIGMPDVLAAGGIIGVWDARKADVLFLYGVHIIGIVEGRDPKELVLKGREVYLTIVDPRSTELKTLWRSEKLKGGVLDVALSDPRTGLRGLAVLTDESDDGKGHTLYFFQLD